MLPDPNDELSRQWTTLMAIAPALAEDLNGRLEAESELLAVIDDCVRALRRPATKATLIACADVLESHVRRYRAAKGEKI